MKVLCLLAMFVSMPLFSQVYEKSFNESDFGKALRAESFIKFEIGSKKFGFIDSSFPGVIKTFYMNFELDKKVIKNVAVYMKGKDLDTDVAARNQEMWENSLDIRRYPNIILALDAPLPVEASELEIPAILDIRGRKRPITLFMSTRRKGDFLTVTGVAKVSLDYLGIPKPDSVFYSLKDEVDVSFNIVSKLGL